MPEAKYRPDIDGLRAIAIISVVFYHAGFPGFSGGFVGVDVFFVISGFLITSLLFNEAMATGTVSLSAFYARRVRRLMPAALVVVAATLVLGAWFIPPGLRDHFALARSAIAVAFFASNFYFFDTTGGYFDGPSFSLPLLHTWSLAVEEQYYLVWPLLMVLVFRLSATPRRLGVMRARVLWFLGGLLLASLALCVAVTADYRNFAFYLLPTRVWEFAIGGLLGLAGNGFHARLRRWADALALAGLALIVYSVTSLNHASVFPGWVAILPVFGTAALIAGMTADAGGWVRRWLASRPMVAIGLVSYAWYLWHWPLLSIYRIYNLGILDVRANAVVVAIALVLAWLSFVLIERPVRLQRPWLFEKVRTTLLAGGAISLATVLMAGTLMVWHQSASRQGEHGSLSAALRDKSPYMKACTLNADRPVGVLPRDRCLHGPDKQHPRILLWGDSHADHLMPMLMDAFADITVYQLAMSGCVPALGYEMQTPARPRFCAEFNQRVLKEVADLKAAGLEGVVISARWPIYLWRDSISLAEQQPGAVPADAQKLARARASMQAGLDQALGQLERAGVRVLVIAPTPELVYPAPQCIKLRDDAFCAVPRAVSDVLIGDATAALAEVVARHPNTRLARVVDFFCDASVCHARREGNVLYFDDDHLTATTARNLGRFLGPDLDWLRGKPQTAAQVKQ